MKTLCAAALLAIPAPFVEMAMCSPLPTSMTLNASRREASRTLRMGEPSVERLASSLAVDDLNEGRLPRPQASPGVRAGSFALTATDAGERASRSDAPASKVRRSIRQWAACDGITDDRHAVDAAFQAAARSSFTLLIDCPVRIHVGMNIDRPIFIESGTRVIFGRSGLFITDNVMVPTWVVANTSRVTLQGWRIRYDGGMPPDPDTGGYGLNGSWITQKGFALPAYGFNDKILAGWLSVHRHIRFAPGTAPIWAGPTNASAMFYITGGSSDLRIIDMKIFVPTGATVDRFIPVAFQSSAGWRSSLSVQRNTPISVENAAVPKRITVRRLDLDGIYMGWVGALRDSTLANIISRRYGDLEGPSHKNAGGVGKWFAPPHLFYLNGYPHIPGLENFNILISDVFDLGPRLGVARDQRSDVPLSGYAASLKIGSNSSIVRRYTTYRPDGVLDLLQSSGLTISELKGTYDSSFLNGIFPGIRFPLGPYRDVLLERVSVRDLARCPLVPAIGAVSGIGNRGVRLRDVVISSVDTRAARSIPRVSGADGEVDIKFHPLYVHNGSYKCVPR